MTERAQTFPLRLAASLRRAVTDIAREEGTSVNQLINVAVAEKISAIRTLASLQGRSTALDRAVFKAVLTRKDGQPPGLGDVYEAPSVSIAAKMPRRAKRKKP